jgi:hypothetical protein
LSLSDLLALKILSGRAQAHREAGPADDFLSSRKSTSSGF